MATSYFLRGVRANIGQFRQAIEAWVEPLGEEILYSTGDVEQQQASLYLFATQCIRGIEVHFKRALLRGGSAELRVGSLGSFGDWQWRARLALALQQELGGKLLDEQGVPADPAKLEGLALQHVWRETFQLELREMVKLAKQDSSQEMFLPCEDYWLRVPLQPAQETAANPQLVPAFERLLTEQSQKYGGAYRPPILQKNGLRVCVCITEHGAEDSLFAEVHHLLIGNEDKSALIIPLEDAQRILGERIEEVQEQPKKYFLQALSPDNPQERALLDELRAAAKPFGG